MERPSQAQILLPLLEVIRECGGRAKPAEVYPRVAAKLGVSNEVREHVGHTAAGPYRSFDRDVRWANIQARARGYLAAPERNLWELTEKGNDALMNAKPGVVITVFETDLGMALWAETQSAMKLLDDGVANVVVTSPPYALVRKKNYANQHAGAEHAEWLFERAREWHRVLAEDGSLFLNLGDVWTPGVPAMDLYQERLIIRLVDSLGMGVCQKLFWQNPSKMPSPAEWVTVRRVRVTPSVEQIWWLSKNPAKVRANNRNVLREYSESMRRLIASGGERGKVRPSGHALTKGAFAEDNGGSIAHSLLTFANTSSNDSYQKFCKEHGLPRHPARFPIELVEWLLKFASEEGDIVVDDFTGSLTTAEACENLKRRWFACDKSLGFLRGGFGRLATAAGARVHLTAENLRARLATDEFALA